MAKDNSSYKSYNGMLLNADLTSLLLVPEGMEGVAVLPNDLATVPACVFSRCTKLSAISFTPGSTDNTSFTTRNGILYTQDMTTLLAAPAGLGASATIAPECTHIAEGAFWGNTSLQTIVSNGNIEDIFVEQNQNASDTQQIKTTPAFNPSTIQNTTVQTTNKEAWEKVGFTNFAEPAKPGTSTGPAVEESGLVYTLLDDYTLSVSFKGESPTQIDIPAQSEIDGISYTVSTLVEEAFKDQTTLEQLTIPETITTIGTSAFENCTSLKEIAIPGSVDTIAANTFANCTSLSNVTLSEGIKHLAPSAFENAGIQQITLPTSIQTLQENTFANCSNLKTIVALGSIEEVSATTISGCSGLEIYTPYQNTSWSAGLPASGNSIYEYGIKPAKDNFELEPNESVNIFVGGGYLYAPGSAQVNMSYRASSVSVDSEGNVVAKQPGSAPVNISVNLGDICLAKATANISVKRVSIPEIPAENASEEIAEPTDTTDEEGGENTGDSESEEELIVAEAPVNPDSPEAAGKPNVINQTLSLTRPGDETVSAEDIEAIKQAEEQRLQEEEAAAAKKASEAAAKAQREAEEAAAEEIRRAEEISAEVVRQQNEAAIEAADAEATEDETAAAEEVDAETVEAEDTTNTETELDENANATEDVENTLPDEQSGVSENNEESEDVPDSAETDVAPVFTEATVFNALFSSLFTALNSGIQPLADYDTFTLTVNGNGGTCKSWLNSGTGWSSPISGSESSGSSLTVNYQLGGGFGANSSGGYGYVHTQKRMAVYTGKYTGNGNTVAGANLYNQNLTVERTGYTCAGFTLDKEGKHRLDTNNTRDLAGGTIYAQWILNSYTITFKNWDGTVFQSSKWDYGTTPSCLGTPTRAGDAQYEYRFSSWSPTISKVTGEATYTAQFTKTLRLYTVTFKNWDGTALQSSNWNYGTTPSYSRDTPTRAGDAQYAYIFSGWSPTISKVTGEATYTAQFTKTLQSYFVTFRNWDETILQFSSWNYGTTPTYSGDTPTRAANAQYTYTFNGWSPAISTVSGATTYTAQFKATLRSYTIKFQNWDGTELQSSNWNYGTTPTYSGNTPTRAADERYMYEFSSWSPTISKVTGLAIYKAQFKATLRPYTVTVDTQGGSVANYTKEYNYDTDLSISSVTKEGCIFMGWKVSCTSDAWWYASYDYDNGKYSGYTWASNCSIFQGKGKYGDLTLTAIWKIPITLKGNELFNGFGPLVTQPYDTIYYYSTLGYNTESLTPASDDYANTRFTAYTWAASSGNSVFTGFPTINLSSYTFGGYFSGTTSDTQYLSGYGSAVSTVNLTSAGASHVPSGPETWYARWFPNIGIYGNGGTLTWRYLNAADTSTHTISKTGSAYFGSIYKVSVGANSITFYGLYNNGTIGCQAFFSNGEDASINKNILKFSNFSDGRNTLYGDYSPPTTANQGNLFYAQWSKVTVSFNLNGGRGTTPDSVTAEYGKAMPVTTSLKNCQPIKTGYWFAGWFDGSDKHVKGNDSTASDRWSSNRYYYGGTDHSGQFLTYSVRDWDKTCDTTLYAGWVPIKYTIKYDANVPEGTTEATGTTKDTEGVLYDEPYTLAKNGYSRTGYTFLGWGRSREEKKWDAGATVSDVNLTNIHNSTVTLYAIWRAHTYTIKYDGNTNTGGSTANTSPVTWDKNVVLAKNGFEKTGYHFIGWAESANGDVVYEENKMTTTFPNLTPTDEGVAWLYAKWEPNTYTVSFNKNVADTNDNVKDMPDSFTIKFSEAALNPANETVNLSSNVPIRIGYKFQGWRITGTDSVGTSIDKVYKPGDLYRHPFASDMTLYAQWEENTDNYRINFYRFTEDGLQDKLELPGGYLSGELDYEERFPLPLADMVKDSDKVSGYYLYGWSWSNKESDVDGAKDTSYVLPHTTSIREIFASLGIDAGDEEPKEVNLYAVWQMVYSVSAPTSVKTASIVLDASEKQVYRPSEITLESSTPCEIAVGAKSEYNKSVFEQVFPNTRSRNVDFAFTEKDTDNTKYFPLDGASPYTWIEWGGQCLLAQELTRIPKGSATNRSCVEAYLSFDFDSNAVNISHELQLDEQSGLLMNGTRWEDPIAKITWMFVTDEASALSYTLLPKMPDKGSSPGHGEINIEADSHPFPQTE